MREPEAHIENARHYAKLGMGDWIAVDGDGRVTFPVGEPTALTADTTKSVRTLKDALWPAGG